LSGIALAFAGIAYGCFLAAYRLIKGPQSVSVNGWTTIVVLVLVLSGLQLGVIGMLGEYLWRALDDVRQRPMFLVQELVGDFRNRQQSQETEVRLSIQSSTVP
jgi:dolichol-phosphate mannosyltransferase